jgi:hypothetical protein
VLVTAAGATGCGGGAGGGAAAAAAPAPSATSGNPALGVSANFTLDRIQVAPYAIWADAIGSQPITVTARTTGTTDIHLSLTYFDELIGGSGQRIVEPMFDDGSHGDATAGDGVFTRTLVLDVTEPQLLRLYDGQIDTIPIAIEASDGRSFVAPSNSIDARTDLALVSPTLRGQDPPQSADATTRVTDTLVNVIDPSFDATQLESLLQRLYRTFPGDPFDFAVIFATRTTGDGIPRSLGVKNDVGGINLAQFDDSAEYGSAGRLQQVVFQNGKTLGLEINHEIGHRWGAYLNKPALNLSLPTGFHWGTSDHVGQMGNGPYLQADGAGYRVGNGGGADHFVSNPFSKLELYLMGLVPPGEVPAYRFVTDPTVDVQFDAWLAETSTRLVTIDDVVSVYGARTPASSTSQNAFTAVFVVVSDAFLSAAEAALSSHIAHYMAGSSAGGQRSGGLFEVSDPPSFSAATGYRASLQTQLPATNP